MLKVLKPVNTLDATVQHTKQSGKIRDLTDARIMFGGVVIAKKMLAGKYEKEEAIADFRKNSGKWTLIETNFLKMARDLKLFS